MEIIQPKDEAHWLQLRTHDITSTECGALFGLDSASYIPTLFELWHRKKNNTAVEFTPNDRVKWGQRLEATIAAGIAEDNEWKVRKMTEYIRLPEERLGASFDFEIVVAEQIPEVYRKHKIEIENLAPGMTLEIPAGDEYFQSLGLLEIKNVDALQLRDKWIIDEDNVEAPAHIELQIQHQLLVSGRKFAYLGALIGGNKVVLLRREPDAAIHQAIKEKAKAFWASVESGKPPAPDFKRDANFISSLYGFAEVGKVIESTGGGRIEELMSAYRLASQEEKRAGEMKEAAKAEMLTLIGDAEKVKGDGWSISAGMIGPAHVEYDRKPYRAFRVTFKKGKGTA